MAQECVLIIWLCLFCAQPVISERIEKNKWEEYEHHWMGDTIPLQNARHVQMSPVSYDIAAQNGRGLAYKPSYGTLEGGMDFYGASETDGLMCGYWEDLQGYEQTLTPAEGAKRMNFAAREKRFMKYFNQAYFGNLPQTDDPDKVEIEMVKEEAVIEGALAEQLRFPGELPEDNKRHALRSLMMMELARVIRGGKQAQNSGLINPMFDHEHAREFDKIKGTASGPAKNVNWDVITDLLQNFKTMYDNWAGVSNGKNLDFLFKNMRSSLMNRGGGGVTETGGDILATFKKLGDYRWWKNLKFNIGICKYNHDHFYPCIKDIYAVGHRLALNEAYAAGKGEPGHTLEKAYAINAFADHLLGDAFAAGHIRTPRVEIARACVRPDADDLDLHMLSAALTAQQMHEEDNRNGLLVTTGPGTGKWMAYGDGDFFTLKNKANMNMALTALEASRDQVFKLYTHGQNDLLNKNSAQDPRKNDQLVSTKLQIMFKMMPRVPKPGDPVFDEALLKNTCPRYRVDNGKLMIRVHHDKIARSKIGVMAVKGKLQSKDTSFWAQHADCAYREFRGRQAGGTHNDCASGSTARKIQDYLGKFAMTDYSEPQKAYISKYSQGELTAGGCHDHHAKFAGGRDGAGYCKCAGDQDLVHCSTAEKLGLRSLSPECTPSGECSSTNRKRCFPVECAQACHCVPAANVGKDIYGARQY